tara:strand:+ start:1401 stop:2720 length:1320 start_codon:yes stop_codon:yes gene_type:complete
MAEAKFEDLRKESEWIETPERANKGAREKLRPFETQYAALNLRHVREELQHGWAADLAEWPDSEKNTPALVIGSGPTADAIMPHLKNWKGAIFVSTSQAATCVYHGQGRINIVAYDVQTQVDELARVDSWAEHPANLLLHPAMAPPFLEWWQGWKIRGAPQGKFYFLPYMPGDWLRTEGLPEMYPFLKARVLMCGSTGGMQFVLARLCGYDPIFTAGLDFGYPGGLDRFEMWHYDPESKSWKNTPSAKIHPLNDPVMLKNPKNFMNEILVGENGCLTRVVHAFYKVQWLKMARMDMAEKPKPQIIVATPGGILDPQLPGIDCPLTEFIERQGQGFEHLYRTNAEMIDAYDRYLVRHGVFPIPIPDKACPDGTGVINLDSKDFENDVPHFIEKDLRSMPSEMLGITADPKDIDTEKVMQYFRSLGAGTSEKSPELDIPAV